MPTHGDRATWIQGPPARCAGTGGFPAEQYRLVLLGAPGIGKGTQAALLHERLGCCPLSTGDVFRAAHRCDGTPTPAMQEAIGCMKRGELVRDELVNRVVEERSCCLKCARGFLLDGYPRTVAQAETLERLLEGLEAPLHRVLSYELADEEIVARLSGRRTCSGCKKVYHILHSPPALEGVCDACGKALSVREDDTPRVIEVRLRAFHATAEPLKEFYAGRGLLRTVDAAGTVDEVFDRAIEALGFWQSQRRACPA